MRVELLGHMAGGGETTKMFWQEYTTHAKAVVKVTPEELEREMGILENGGIAKDCTEKRNSLKVK